jgi:hypothetical protein
MGICLVGRRLVHVPGLRQPANQASLLNVIQPCV